jgi:hypothetical protein
MNFGKKSNKLIILTGAGFTKNFNGFLAVEMWSKIFNHSIIKSHQKLKALLQDDFDFESVYSNIINGDFTEEEKAAIKTVIEDVYKELDDAIRRWVFNDDNPTALNTYGLWGDLLTLFNGEPSNLGWFFTLNQDLLLERHNGFRSPGVPWFNQSFYSLSGQEFQKSYFVSLPSSDVEEKIKKDIESQGGIHYIKLHGSYGWKASDGSNRMVIGKNKVMSIEQEPLLKAYLNIFKDVIKEGDKKLLIIGYGFGDQHINEILLEGIEKYSLKLYIITTTSPKDFDSNLRNGHFYALPIKNGIDGYFPYRLSEIFPKNQERSVHIDEIRRSLIQ